MTSTTEYPRTRKAALAISRDKKALAEALYVEIPPQGPGRKKAESDVANVMAELGRAAELLREDGHDYAVETLASYRRTAGWVAGNRVDTDSISWRPVSYSLHREAYAAGRSMRQFDAFLAKCEKNGTKPTCNALRESLGYQPKSIQTTDVPTPREAVKAAPKEEQARIVAEALLDPEVAAEVTTNRAAVAAIGNAEIARAKEAAKEADAKMRGGEDARQDAEARTEIDRLTGAADSIMDGAIFLSQELPNWALTDEQKERIARVIQVAIPRLQMLDAYLSGNVDADEFLSVAGGGS